MKTIADINLGHFQQLLARFNIDVKHVTLSENIPGSYWGAPEAGIIQNRLYIRDDTPVHSALHESCHYVCMDQERRQQLHTDTGGDYDEENAVCFLQILLADYLPNVGQQQLCADMDTWGYTFRLGSAARWFQEDAESTLDWLLQYELITEQKIPTWHVRQ